ncbi:hypothetical protein phiAS5_ORF0217 [Aeromonas phage phiAS5]|uniref:Uncharacterized protein n=1 Tax=Aeromonas phage phiAS5 TaxID=879630 RepID=E1A1X1_9CAUD|nr:hypothetical protein phiAS5_ORF0217 [Aeromonas phage phiAS5]ADM80060.1 hypothetical protein phiAS5_ORF0217 [Aeromonas phage phiAS5]
MAYVNPDAAPEHVIEKMKSSKRTIKVRFATKEKFDAFVAQTGLAIDKNTKHVKFPQHPGLASIFEI